MRLNRPLPRLLLLLAAFLLPACSPAEEAGVSRATPVETLEVREVSVEEVLHYFGVVEYSGVRRHSFKSAGRIAEIPVEEGQPVEVGSVLARLDTGDLDHALEAAKAAMEAARSQYDKALRGPSEEEVRMAEAAVDKAREAFRFARTTYERMEALHGEGAISDQDLDEAALQLSIREAELRQAEENLALLKRGPRDEDKEALYERYRQAEAEYLHQKDLIEDAVLISDRDAYVIEILNEEGELVPAGQPVVVTGGQEQVVTVGVVGRDVGRLSPGVPVRVRTAEGEFPGTIGRIDQVPRADRSYTVEVNLDAEVAPFAETVEVDFILGNRRGILVPVTSVLSEGEEDYVFVVEGGRAVRRMVTLGEVMGDRVMVRGLEDGEVLVTAGMIGLEDGDEVIVRGAEK